MFGDQSHVDGPLARKVMRGDVGLLPRNEGSKYQWITKIIWRRSRCIPVRNCRNESAVACVWQEQSVPPIGPNIRGPLRDCVVGLKYVGLIVWLIINHKQRPSRVKVTIWIFGQKQKRSDDLLHYQQRHA